MNSLRGSSSKNNRLHRTKRKRQDCIDSLGVLSAYYGKTATKTTAVTTTPATTTNPADSAMDKTDASALYAASLLVGRTFQYVTRKGERKKYTIRSYRPWNGTHRVQRCGKGRREYKTKVIDLNELPNIRWLDDDKSDNDDNDNSDDGDGENEAHLEAPDNASDNQHHPTTTSSAKTKTTEEAAAKAKVDEVDFPHGENENKKPKIADVQALTQSPETTESTSQPKTMAPLAPPLPQKRSGEHRNQSPLKKRKLRVEAPIQESLAKHPQTPENNSNSNSVLADASSTAPEPNISSSKPTRSISNNSADNTSFRTNHNSSVNYYRTPKSCKSSSYNGVSANVKDGSLRIWKAFCKRKSFVQSHGKKFIGSFQTEKEAALAFDAALRTHCGTELLHVLNFPTASEQEQIQRQRERRQTMGVGNVPTHSETVSVPSKSAQVQPPGESGSKKSACTSPAVRVSPDPTARRRVSNPAPKPQQRRRQRRVSELTKGDRIAFGMGRENCLHFGTITDCGIKKDHDDEDELLDRTWTVAFDVGEIYEMEYGNLEESLSLYEKVLEDEASYPLPTKGSPQVGNRIAHGFGASGIHFGNIQSCEEDGEDKLEGQRIWTVEFDDGEVHEFDSLQMNKSIDLYRRIRAGKSAQSLLGTGSSTASEGPIVATRRLLNMVVGDRIAYDFGAAGVFFGSVEESYASHSQPRKEWRWDIVFDDGDRYKFDPFEMARAVALYEKIKQSERNDPTFEDRIRECKRKHLAQKKSIEKRIPARIKNRFLQAGFARWSKSYLPVLFLGPYDVSPGNIREEWLEAFEKVGRSHKKIPQIVYWFGVAPDKGFSILEDSDCLTLAEAKKQGLLRQKDGTSKAAEKYNHALFKLKEALKKPPENRPPLGKAQEVHERVSGPKADRLLAEFEAARQL